MGAQLCAVGESQGLGGRGDVREEIEAAVKAWQARMGLSDWQIQVVCGPITGGSRATCEAAPEYPEMTLHFDPEAMEKAGDTVGGTVPHEMAHGLQWELAQEGLELCDLLYRDDPKARAIAKRRVRRYEERATSLVQRALLAAYEAGRKGL